MGEEAAEAGGLAVAAASTRLITRLIILTNVGAHRELREGTLCVVWSRRGFGRWGPDKRQEVAEAGRRAPLGLFHPNC